MKAIYITVRTASTRLPEKCLLKIGSQSTLEIIIERMRRSKHADKIIVCTTDQQRDELLTHLAQKEGVSFFQGPEKDKLERWNQCSKKFGVEVFATADGDDLLCEPKLIDLAFEQFEKNKPDFITTNVVPCGAFTHMIKAEALKKVCEMKDTDDTEMMVGYFTDTGQFQVESLENIPTAYKRPEIRMTLDYQEDFEFFERVIGDIGNASLSEVLKHLDAHPEIIKINQFRQKEFEDNQRRKTHIILKKESP